MIFKLSNNAVAAAEAVCFILYYIPSLPCLSNPAVLIKLNGQSVNSPGMNNVERYESNNFHTQAIFTGILACRTCLPYKAKRLWREKRLYCGVIFICQGSVTRDPHVTCQFILCGVSLILFEL
jgi:hypothetical protein